MQMTHSYMQPCNKSNTFMTITIKNITWGRSNKFQDTIHSMIVEGKKDASNIASNISRC